MGTYKDSVPVTKDVKEIILRLQPKLAEIKGVPKIAQIDLMLIMTEEFEKICDKQLELLHKQ